MTYTRYIICTFTFSMWILIMISIFNYRMDPGIIFGNRELITTCGDWLLEGHDVAFVQDYSERLLTKYLIEHDARNYDVLVFGSSRTMDIGKDLFVHDEMKNYSVSGASIKDILALYFLYERRHKLPKKIIIGADAWLLNENAGSKRWKALAKDVQLGKDAIGVESDSSAYIEKYVELITWPYLDASIKKFRKEKKSNDTKSYCLADDKTKVDNDARITCADGSHIPSKNRQEKESDPLARQYISGNVYFLEKYDELDVGLQTEFKRLIVYLDNQGIEIVFYLTPYHPIVYSYLLHNEKYHNVMEAETFFRKLGEKNGIKVVGSYDPDRCGLSNADFLDGMHMRREAVERILRGKL